MRNTKALLFTQCFTVDEKSIFHQVEALTNINVLLARISDLKSSKRREMIHYQLNRTNLIPEFNKLVERCHICERAKDCAGPEKLDNLFKTTIEQFIDI